MARTEIRPLKCMKRGWRSQHCFNCRALWKYSKDCCSRLLEASLYHIRNPTLELVKGVGSGRRAVTITVYSKSGVRRLWIAGTLPLELRKGETWYVGKTNNGIPVYIELDEYPELIKT